LFNPLFGDDIPQVISATNQQLYTYTIEKESSSLDESLKKFNDSQTFLTIQIFTDNLTDINVIEQDVIVKLDKNLQFFKNISQESFTQRLYIEQQAITLSVFREMSTGRKYQFC